MALTDCVRCWDTPCTCGYSYRSWRPERLRAFIERLEAVLAVSGAGKVWCRGCDAPIDASGGENLCPACVERVVNPEEGSDD